MNLVWLRNDLRLEDNPALHHACSQGDTCCVYTVTPQQWQQHDDAPAKIAFWRARLIEVGKELSEYNIPLKIIIADNYLDTPKALQKLASQLGTSQIFFNIEYPLNEKNRDAAVKLHLMKHGITTHRYHGDVVMPPSTVKTQQDKMYKVFTPFLRQWHKQVDDHNLHILSTPKKQGKMPCASDDIDTAWAVESNNTPFRQDLWPISTKDIHQKLGQFCVHAVSQYKEQRDIPSINGTSTLSPYLMMGAVSVRQCIASVRLNIADWRSNQWVTELVWREFYRHLIDYFPHISRSENFIQCPNPIPWNNDQEVFDAWCKGETGFPIVDAAMKQLVRTGWMHNRLRMVTAAFLTKLLLVDWRKGEAFFMQHLIDGDYASNNGGWQWASSTGADAAPYFRIFSPERQSQRFDPDGIFIKKLLPELSTLDKKSIHTPSSQQRSQCQYPEPIVDYKWARGRAMDVFAAAMSKNQ